MRYLLFEARDQGRPFPIVLAADRPTPDWPALRLEALGTYGDQLDALKAWERRARPARIGSAHLVEVDS